MRILLLLILLPFCLHAELDQCDSCSVKRYSEDEIKHLSSYKLRLLRNEIFARKGYIFSDSNLTEQFTYERWYKPTTKDVTLNDIEKHNIQLFKQVENRNKKEIAIFEKKLKDFLYCAKEERLNDLYPQVSDSLTGIRDSLFFEIIDQFDPSDITLGMDPVELSSSGVADGFSVRYNITIRGYWIIINRHTDCPVGSSNEEETEADFCPEYSEFFHLYYKDGKIYFKEFVPVG